MHRREYHTLGRAKLAWGTGPWQEEPDAVGWVDEHTGLPCVVRRHSRAGHWCGYVGLPSYHIWYGKHYVEIPAVEVHGGLSHSDFHIPNFSEPPTEVWWLGFALNEDGDVSPGIPSKHRNAGGHVGIPHTYKNLAYAAAQCAKLAEQLSRAPL